MCTEILWSIYGHVHVVHFGMHIGDFVHARLCCKINVRKPYQTVNSKSKEHVKQYPFSAIYTLHTKHPQHYMVA